jgi:hypothetical protein
MTIFEYLSVVTSIVLSLSAAQLLAQLRAVFRPERRYWIHALWVVFALLIHLLVWWEFWGYRVVESWNFASFALLLLNPGILYICSSALVHSERAEAEDWSRHFFEVRKTVFLTFAMLTVVSVLRRWMLTDVPILTPGNIPEALFAILFISAFLFRSTRSHAVIVVASWLLLLVTIGNSWFQPGAVASPPQ